MQFEKDLIYDVENTMCHMLVYIKNLREKYFFIFFGGGDIAKQLLI